MWLFFQYLLTLQDHRGATRAYSVARTLVLPAGEAEAFVLDSPADPAFILVTCFAFDYLVPGRPNASSWLPRPATNPLGGWHSSHEAHALTMDFRR